MAAAQCAFKILIAHRQEVMITFPSVSDGPYFLMSDHAFPSVLFAGDPGALTMAYDEASREVIGTRARVLPGILNEQTLNEGTDTDSLATADYILATWGMPKMDARLLDAMPRLRAVFYAAGSVKYFLTPAVAERGIAISSAWRANAIPVAEYTLGAILLGLKSFFACSTHLRNSKSWTRPRPVPGLYKSRVGLISLGAIGRRVVDLLKPFELEVCAWDPHLSPDDVAPLAVRLAGLDEIFEESDVVSVHAPWLPETVGLVDSTLLRAMRPGAVFINTSRGAVVDEPALIETMRERPDLTAILDVTYPEPPPSNSPLFTLPNVYLTPHIAGSVGGEVSRMGEWMVDELLRALEGTPLKHAVDPELTARMA